MLRSLVQRLYERAYAINLENIKAFLPRAPDASLLDLGCDDGSWSRELAEIIGTERVFGVEIVPSRAAAARARGVAVTETDLAKSLPFPDASFDVVHANQVIEHVPDLDMFMAETFRVLKPGGRALISTENGSSWHNIGAAIFGWQMFSLTNCSSKKAGIGNPFALHRGESIELSSWTHKTIFNYRGLTEFMEAHGFVDVTCRGAGYHPAPASFGRVDPRHAHFLAVCGQKP